MSQPVFLTAPHFSFTHAFSTRHGGVSQEPFHSLNLGGTLDRQEYIDANRKLFAAALGFDITQVARLHQVHGTDVLQAKPGVQTGDALVTNEKGILLAIGAADCYPLLFEDAQAGVIGAAHAGWKGTLGRIAMRTIEKMISLGAESSRIRIAIGPGISCANYEVGEELITKFRSENFPETCFSGIHLDLLEANRTVLLESGIAENNIWMLNRCTTEDDFFSHRRDKGVTGRLWGVIGMKSA
ncbi:MAG: hypothetical protein FD123_3010 [Bacteroidetes bacterium]|nr:MAG: hypothetical protein FD123_3010 [Bacteroidota bacterium]